MPDWISPPGETIEDLLDERGWSKKDFSERIGLSPKHVNELIHGRAAISAAVAEKLSIVLGSTAEFWLSREAQYQAALEHCSVRESAAEASDWLRELPIRCMKKFGWIRGCSDKGEQVLECLSYFGVASVDLWRQRYQNPLTAFRASGRFEKKCGSVAAWLRQGELAATEVDCAAFDRAGFRSVLGDLRSLSNEPKSEVFTHTVRETCAQHGVAVVFVPAPQGCPASGATRWLTSSKAMLLLSLRHKSNDHLWFSFFHEAAHILLHGKKMFFIDGLDGLNEEAEEEANHFASNLLIPSVHTSRLARVKRSKRAVIDFAAEIGVAPGVVVGRLQKEGLIPYSYMNDLKVRYCWAE